MITTQDGITKKRGEIVFEIGYNTSTGQYVPLPSRVNINLNNDSSCYSTLELCQAECSRRNEINSIKNQPLAEKRQLFHRMLIRLGDEKYKDIIVSSEFPGIESTKELNEEQLDKLIANTQVRISRQLKERKTAAVNEPEEYHIKQLRNKILQVLAQRGIESTPKDWSKINTELTAARYQWILTDEQRSKGFVNKRGLGAFQTVQELQKLFHQICSIRDNEQYSKKQRL